MSKGWGLAWKFCQCGQWYKYLRGNALPSQNSTLLPQPLSPPPLHSNTVRTIMYALKAVMGAAVLLAGQVLAETHTISFTNRCGHGTVSHFTSGSRLPGRESNLMLLAYLDPRQPSPLHWSSLHREWAV